MGEECIDNIGKGTVVEESHPKISVLLVDDHIMVRKSLRKIIGRQDDMTVIGEASNGEEAVRLARDVCPQVVVMDVNMPVMDGIAATRQITTGMPDVHVVGLSLHDSQEVIDSMRSAGASAYIVKSKASEKLCIAIRTEIKVNGKGN